MTVPSPRLWDLLHQQVGPDGFAAGELDRIRGDAEALLARQATPWYLQLFLFLGALVAAAMFSVAVVFAIGFHGAAATTLFTVAACYLVGAVVLHRCLHNVYAEALALALSIAGHGFAMAGVVEDGGEFFSCFAVALGLCVALYPIYVDRLHRFASCLLVLALAKGALVQVDPGGVLPHLAVAATTVALAVLLTRERELPVWRPLAHACAIGLLVLLLPVGGREGGDLEFLDHAFALPWIDALVQGVALLWILHWASGRDAAVIGRRATVVGWIIAVVVVVGLIAMSAPGIVAALFLAVLGHATHRGLITVLALVSLPAFLWKYYYHLEVDLLEKSAVLAASGVVLLIVRAIVVHPGWSAESEAAP